MSSASTQDVRGQNEQKDDEDEEDGSTSSAAQKQINHSSRIVKRLTSEDRMANDALRLLLCKESTVLRQLSSLVVNRKPRSSQESTVHVVAPCESCEDGENSMRP